jgi:tetratricopeptide (TPR) repeat protein
MALLAIRDFYPDNRLRNQGFTMKRFLLSVVQLLLLFPAAAVMASPVSSTLIEEGNRYWSENRLDDAESSFRKAIEADSESSVAYSRLGALLVMQNRGEEAVAAYQEAIIREPDNAQYFAALSIAYLHMGYHEMARAMATRATELDPGMKHARDITKYIDAKMDRMSELAAREAHGSAGPEEIRKSEGASGPHP